jgi:hypothetical protein
MIGWNQLKFGMQANWHYFFPSIWLAKKILNLKI